MCHAAFDKINKKDDEIDDDDDGGGGDDGDYYSCCCCCFCLTVLHFRVIPDCLGHSDVSHKETTWTLLV